MSTFTSKFGIGDIVYTVSELARDYKAKCALCSGSGKVGITGGERQVECPDCYGNGWKWSKEDRHNEYVALTVGQVRITADIAGVRVQYMCNETGVGSGTVHNEESFFHSAEDAKDECARRDAVLADGVAA